jgi:pimeloyl-ACP methyl ester carboxylesterase
MHHVYTPTLSGLGDRAHLIGQPINLSTHIQDIVAIIRSEDLHDIILCGHSYGAMVITGVAGEVGDRIKTLFYLDSSVPNNNQSLFDILGPERGLLMLEAAGETGTMVQPSKAKDFQVNSADIEWVDKHCTPHPIGCFVQKLQCTGKEALVRYRTYVLAERFKGINYPTYARVKNLPGWKAVSLDSGHDVMVDNPDALVALLLEELER